MPLRSKTQRGNRKLDSTADGPFPAKGHVSSQPLPRNASERAHSAASILVVDPEESVRRELQPLLAMQGYRVQCAACAAEALAELERHSFDLILTNIDLRDANGIALLEHLAHELPQTPVMVLTETQEVAVIVEAMRRGACDYLIRPILPEALMSAVVRGLRRRQTLQENLRYRQNLEEAVQARTEQLQKAMDQLELSYDITLEALGDALDLKDSETEGHSKRVTAYTIALARAFGLASDEIKIIARGAFLHDVGKMAIPDEILRKPGRLTIEERDILREHCLRGYHMLRKIPFLEGAAEIVFSHQEHYDGSGYPRGLKGARIPIGARIFALADTVDAITSDRPYRKASDFDAARAEILRHSGTQFDPAVVEVFLKIPNDLWNELRTEISNRNQRLSPFDLVRLPVV